MIDAKFVPSMLVKGVADDGREYDLPGFGHWMEEELSPDQAGAVIESGYLTKKQARAFWQWANRAGPPPKRLKLYVMVNPEFNEWVLMARVHDFVCARLNGDRKLTEDSLLQALRAGQIRSRGNVECDGDGRIVRATEIEFNTADVVKWLELEHGIKATVNQIACWPGDGTVMDAISGKGSDR